MTAPTGETVTVEADDQTGTLTDPVRWCTLAREVLVEEGVTIGHLDLIFVDPEAMTVLNRDHMGHDGPTDVLAFPLDGPELARGAARIPASGGRGQGGPPPHLGDVVICPSVAEAQAPDHTGSMEAEVALLVVHGILHVLGHDHAEPGETALMQGRERHHLGRIGCTHPVPPPGPRSRPAAPVGGIGEGR
jgi:probable rRNA maturation factor